MEYIEFGKTGLQVSRFGMGCMRPPTVEGAEDMWDVDEPEYIRMMHYAVDNGVNYFDTAYAYGPSEEILGKALAGGRREKVLIATKLPPSKYDDPEACLDEELERLQTDYVDFYLIHGLNDDSWANAQEKNLLGFLDDMKRKGKIRHAGFSFHSSVKTFKEILDSYDWAMCQIELNYLYKDYQAGVTGLKYAASKGVPVVIMEPLKGGLLSNTVPADVQQLFEESGEDWSAAEWALRWLGNQPEVSVVLSGVSNMAQLEEDIEIFSRSPVGCLSNSHLDVLDRARALYQPKINVGCTGCGYCMPCPENVNIWLVFRMYDNIGLGQPIDKQRGAYKRMLIDNGRDASKCIQCGKCEKACPQHIQIIEKLGQAHEVLAPGDD